MTVFIEPRYFSVDERREHVMAYLERPYGMKGAYLDEHQISPKAMSRWRAALADGDLGLDQVPRKTGTMKYEDVAEIRRLKTEIARLEAELKDARGQRETMARAADALGKAIDAMQRYGVVPDKEEPS